MDLKCSNDMAASTSRIVLWKTVFRPWEVGGGRWEVGGGRWEVGGVFASVVLSEGPPLLSEAFPVLVLVGNCLPGTESAMSCSDYDSKLFFTL